MQTIIGKFRRALGKLYLCLIISTPTDGVQWRAYICTENKRFQLLLKDTDDNDILNRSAFTAVPGWIVRLSAVILL